uniref:Dynamin-type G domain-containing protein n=1 Tax=Alexandrium monilatum TaxID=311494 RepID=A0A7S4SN74_9DINO|mmetsp:Transcript_35977/g.111782  ORF Transcript_35977/g.111782 Transcript_35977/m.111782 type:complete len:465 (-) Transcript_35977:40-1434(-)
MGNTCAPPRERESTNNFQAYGLGEKELYDRSEVAQATRNSTAFSVPDPKAPSPVLSVPRDEQGGGWPFNIFSGNPSERAFLSVGEALGHFYQERLLPLELDSGFHQFHAVELAPAHFLARPLILTIGQYSTGKTTFIRHLIESDYPGQHIGPEPTTDRFVVVCHGEEVQKIQGNALVYDTSLPFTPLSSFGNGFLCRLECARLPSPILEGVTFVDTPGVLSGEKQRLRRGYDFEEVITWFVDQAAMVILFFDAHKLDISDEFKRCISALTGSFQKVQILLNKADRMNTQQLMRVHGALMWALGKIMESPEVARVYVGSFWDEPLEAHELAGLFEREKDDLYTQIQHLPRSATVQKINDLSRRARLVKSHALLLEHLRNSMPSIFGQAQQWEDLLRRLPSVYLEVSQKSGVPLGDFPDSESMKQKLAMTDYSKLPRLDQKKVEKLNVLLSNDIPSLLRLVPAEEF